VTWFASLFISFLTALVGLFATGVVAGLAVDWYDISGREGGSGYFVAGLAIVGFIVGGILGLIICRIVAAGADPSFFKGLGLAISVCLSLAGLGAVNARSLADIPPTIGGETLVLAVEVRWPEGQEVSPALDANEFSLYLHSIPAMSHTVRASVHGPLWKEDARLVDGRWVVPGALELFTRRGKRLMAISTDPKSSEGFLLPVPSRPGKADLEWTDWLPRPRNDGAKMGNRFTYRYRVQRASVPVRTQVVGPFEISTIASKFFDVQVDGKYVVDSTAEFELRYRGQPLALAEKPEADAGTSGGLSHVSSVALLAGPDTALVVHATGETDSEYVVTEKDGRVVVKRIGSYAYGPRRELTSDNAIFRAAGQRSTPLRGSIDRDSFSHAGLYLFNGSVFDSRTLVVHPFKGETPYLPIPSVAPLGISPDERSYAWFGYAENTADKPMIVVTDFIADRSYGLPIDPIRMRFAKFDVLDPDWLAHHFAWQRDSQGVDQLVERAHFAPLTNHGEFKVEGGASVYRLEPVGLEMRVALEEFLTTQFKAELQPAEPSAYEHSVQVDGQVLRLACSTDSEYLMVSLHSGTPDSKLVATIASRFDSELATGKFDPLFKFGTKKYHH
jgi:hypothetical protein